MYWLDNSTGVTTPPTIPPVQSPVRRYFTEGGSGLPPSTPGGEWFNMVTDELLALLALANITPDKADHSQIAKAIQAIAFSAYPVGSPIPWPKSVPPTGFLAMAGQSFNPSTYPKLALVYPSGYLPDMRGEFIRGLDSGRGKDSGRTVISAQPGSLAIAETVDRVVSFSRMQNIKSLYFDSSIDASTSISAAGIASTLNTIVVPNSQYVGVVRPTNIAFYYVTKGE